jgi:hypothetical protein
LTHYLRCLFCFNAINFHRLCGFLYIRYSRRVERLVLAIENSDYASQDKEHGANHTETEDFLARLCEYGRFHFISPTPRRFAALIVVRQATIAIPRFRLHVDQTIFDDATTAIH